MIRIPKIRSTDRHLHNEIYKINHEHWHHCTLTKSPVIETEIIPSVQRCDVRPNQVDREFRQLLKTGIAMRVAGTARKNPKLLFDLGLHPKHKIELFDTRFYLTNVRQIPELTFFVGYVVQPNPKNQLEIFPRILYKDLSLAWRSASHFTCLNDEIWIGKGDVRETVLDGMDMIVSNEATTDLPLEIQTALESLLPWSKRAVSGAGILDLVLRKASYDRIEPYQDFVKPRRRAASNSKNWVNRGRTVARFKRKNDPASLYVVAGFEPDFDNGIIERSFSRSRLYGGRLQRFRILSINRTIQYFFFAGVKHVWIVAPQALTTELSSYGVRTIDVAADDDLFLSGYEYHHYESTKHGTELFSQIPTGFAGDICPMDEDKADASPWLNNISLIRQFKRKVLGVASP